MLQSVENLEKNATIPPPDAGQLVTFFFVATKTFPRGDNFYKKCASSANFGRNTYANYEVAPKFARTA